MSKSIPLGAASAPLLTRLPTWLHFSDIQGLAQLATQGVLGVAGLAETVQGNVYKAVAATLPGGSKFVDRSPGSSGVKPFGITGLVYGGVRVIARLTGGTANAVLSRVVPLAGTRASSPQREAMLSAINGVLGDQLVATANPLAITMQLRRDGEALPLLKAALAQRLPKATGKILLVIHGLCMNDLQWTSGGHNHADELARELGYTPVYLHYNTGLHTATNGAQLAAVLEQLLPAWPVPVTDLTLLVHSMGGLVARSACQQAEEGGMAWRRHLKNIIFLGTPHHGAPLERLGNWLDVVLGSNLVTRPFAKIGQVRSSGITDLRYGHVLPSGIDDADRFEMAPDTREPLPLPEGVSCYAVAATTSCPPGDLKDQLVGDGLVPVRSALGQHDDLRHTLGFAADNQWVAAGVNHMDLIKLPEITAHLQRWLR